MTHVIKKNPERFKRFAPDKRAVIPPDAPPPEPGVWGHDETGKAVFIPITIPDGYDPLQTNT